MTEKRGYQRFAVWFPVTIRVPDEPGAEVWAICRDASAGGVLVSATAEIDVGAKVELRFRLDPHETAEHVTRAQVVRHEQTRDELVLVFPYRMAFEFASPHTELLEALRAKGAR